MKEVLESIMKSDIGQLAKWQKIQQKLLQEGLAWFGTLPCDQLGVHPCNRGGSGVQPYQVHQTGETIVLNGADIGLLTSSVCFEMNPQDEKKKIQVAFNESLVQSSEGMLAFTGKERYVTVAKSHTSQFIKAVMCGCKTPTTLAVNGSLCKETLCRHDEALTQMVEVGWQWLIVSFTVEEALPSLPNLATLACNSTNSNYEACGELELMSHLTLESSKQGDDMDWDVASTNICNGGPVASYAKSIGRYVKLFSGGSGFRLVHFLVGFAKGHAGGISFGKEFFQCVAHIELHQSKMMPFVRLSLLCTNLAAPADKVVDGFSRLLLKADIEKLKQKKFASALEALEQALEEAWAQCSALGEALKAKIYGKFCVRAALSTLGKSKQGPEKKDMTLDECKAKFESDLNKGNAHKLVPDPKAMPATLQPGGHGPVTWLVRIQVDNIACFPKMITFYESCFCFGMIWTPVQTI